MVFNIKKFIFCLKQFKTCFMARKAPLTTNRFIVDWGGVNLGFMEVSGLDIEVDVIEYREGSSTEPNPVLMPGLIIRNNIILKRGILKGDLEFYEWIKNTRAPIMGNLYRDITIKLLDEEFQPVIIWRAENAWPVKLTGPVLKANANEVAVETLEIAHEGLTIEVR